MLYRSLLLLCIVLRVSAIAHAQAIESNSNRERNFAFEVKQIDEFIDRFNNVPNSLYASYLALNFPNVRQDRFSMLKTLFNKPGKTLEPALVGEFCAAVADTGHPSFLDFYSNDWYAEAFCKFLFRGVPIEVVILLKIRQTDNGGSKWMIMGASSRDLIMNQQTLPFPVKASCCKFLNPMSHATNFISLSRALNDKINIPDYLDTNFFRFPSSASFIRELLRDQLKYQFVKEIRYHFLQVDGWVFTVNQYRRQGVNSGWLISSLKRVTEEEKIVYRKGFVEPANELMKGEVQETISSLSSICFVR